MGPSNQFRSRILMKLLRHLSVRQASQGFVLPMIIGLGLIMTVVGLTMIGRSSDEEMVAESQQQSAQALATAETGITRIQELFLIFPGLAKKDLGEWQSYIEEEKENLQRVVACNNNISFDDFKKKVEKFVNNNWISLGKTGGFRLDNYQYNDTDPNNLFGTLEILGSSEENPTDNSLSQSKLQVEIPVNAKPPGSTPVPGFLGKEGNFSNNELKGDALFVNCSLDEPNIDIDGIQGNATADIKVNFPELPDPTNEVKPEKLGDIEDDMTLPEDATNNGNQDKDGRYHYIVDSIKMSGGNRTLKIETGEQVAIYMRGNIELKGNATIEHDCNGVPNCNPTNFQIFGGDGKGEGYREDTTTEICLSGASTIDAFIYAPEANVAVNGSGSGDGITGTVWANRWNVNGCGSNTGQTVLIQNATWNDIPFNRDNVFTIISPATNWERQSVEE